MWDNLKPKFFRMNSRCDLSKRIGVWLINGANNLPGSYMRFTPAPKMVPISEANLDYSLPA